MSMYAPLMSHGFNLPPVDAIPQFTAGLIYGLTGDNHLDEIEKCMDTSEPMIEDFLAALDDFRHLKAISGLKHIGDIIWLLPNAFQPCTGMDDDIQAIEEWADIFHHPARLADTVAKNWLKNGKDIKKKMKKQKEDWHDEKWYKCGDKTADALVLLLGPIEPHHDFTDFAMHWAETFTH